MYSGAPAGLQTFYGECESTGDGMTTLQTERHHGYQARDDALAMLTTPAQLDHIATLATGAVDALRATACLQPRTCRHVLADLTRDPGWQREYWRFTNGDQVAPTSAEDFSSAAPVQRFSQNDCLRRPTSNTWALRGFLSAITSAQVEQAFSHAYGRAVRFKSADMARYRRGDYLRRHADLFDGRCFGLVWILGSGWRPGYGGELVTEAETGAAQVIAPTQGTVALLGFGPDRYHHVAQVQVDGWERYSVATHFALAT